MLEIFRYNSSNENQWDLFVPKTNNGTLFHLRSFLNYHPKNKYVDHSLMIFKKGKLFSVFPAVESFVKGNKNLVSHPGATVGSFALYDTLSISDAINLAQYLVEYAKEKAINNIRIALPPNLYQKRLSNYMEFGLFKTGFQYLKREVTSILFLEDSIESTCKKFRPSHMRAIRKSIGKGVITRQSNNIKSFYAILQKNLKIRHGVKPTHSLEELMHLFDIFPDKIKLFCAYKGEIMIAGVVTFQINSNVLLAFYISHDEDYSELRSVNALFYHIFEWAIKSNFKVFDFGIFTINGEPNMGLGRFKENFGASGIFRDTIELKIK